MSTQKNSNDHRAMKRSFQANLKPDENDLVNQIKALRDVKTDRDLLLLLCREAMQRGAMTVGLGDTTPQQKFLRVAMKRLGMTRDAFCDRIGVKRRALDNWLLPDTSVGSRPMPEHIRILVDEILDD